VAEKPVYYSEIRARLEKKYSAQVIAGAEADDALAIRMMEQHDPDEVVCCSIDKDLRQVPGRHYSWVKDEMFYIAHDDGLKLLFQQALSGDATDNIRGIPGIGTKRAQGLLAECVTWPEHCDKALSVYLENGLTEEDFIECFNLVYLCRTQEELLNAQQAAAKGSPGISPWTAEGSKERVYFMSTKDFSTGGSA
jgi:5'-3' exonuclease